MSDAASPIEPLLRQDALAPIEPLLRDPQVIGVMIDGWEKVYIEKGGAGSFTDVPTPFHNDEEVYALIRCIIEPMGRRVDESNPIQNLRLPDGSLVMVVIPPIALNGPSVTLRKTLGRNTLTMDLLLEYGCLSKTMADFLQACVQARLNIAVGGGANAGKTTVLHILSRWIQEDERIIVCQNDAFHLAKKHVVNLETRPANLEGRGEVSMRDLVNAAGFMRPDRIIVTEVMGAEVVRLLELMNNGHDGTMFSVHGSSAMDILTRIEVLAGYASPPLPLPVVREQMASALNIVTFQEYMADGRRRITRIAEVTGLVDGVITTQDLFVFRRTGMKDGQVQGYYTATGVLPSFLEQLHDIGGYWKQALPVSMFTPAAQSS